MFFAISSNSDARAPAATPILLRNVYIEKNAQDADGRKPFYLTPTPGKRKRLTLPGGVCRGIYCRDGVGENVAGNPPGGTLFAVAGTRLYSVDDNWSAADLGEIVGTRPALMRAFEANLLILGDLLYQYGGYGSWQLMDGTPWTTVSGDSWDELPNSPSLVGIASSTIFLNTSSTPETLEVLSERALISPAASDTFDWSSVDNALTWPAAGFASSQARPDRIVGQFVVGSYLFSMGSETMQIWRGVGGQDEAAFDVLGLQPIEKGLISRDAAAVVDQSLFWIGNDRAAYQAQNFFPSPLINRQLEQALKVTDASDPAEDLLCCSYRDGSKLFFEVRLKAGPAYVMDVALSRWHERATWQGAAWAGGFAATAYGQQVIASPDSADIWTYDASIYDDAGTTVERVMSLFLPFSGPTTVSSIILDMRVFGQSLATRSGSWETISGDKWSTLDGQYWRMLEDASGASNPKAMVTYYKDGGREEEIGDERVVSLGKAGDSKRLIKMTGFGRFDGNQGALLKIRIMDPIGFSIYGVYVNEDPSG